MRESESAVIGALSGFAVVGFAILVGYITGRTGILGEHGRQVLGKLAFHVLAPVLLFHVLATTNVAELFTNLLPVSAIAAMAMFAAFVVVALSRRQPFGTAVVGALSAGYVNSNNIGIPIATFMLGGAKYAAPIILVQLIFWAPLALASLDAWRSGTVRIHLIALRTLRNPIIVGSLLGLLVTVSGLPVPPIVFDATDFVGQAAVPIMLIAFGMSLHGRKVFDDRSQRVNIVVASTLKLLVMPVLAWALATWVFGLDHHAIYAVTVLAALPTAQNVFNYASEYRTGEILARDTIFLTTFGAVPALLAVTLLLT